MPHDLSFLDALRPLFRDIKRAWELRNEPPPRAYEAVWEGESLRLAPCELPSIAKPHEVWVQIREDDWIVIEAAGLSPYAIGYRHTFVVSRL